MTRYEEICSNLADRTSRWVVTGAAGFIGSHLVERLLGLGQQVTGLDSFLSGSQANIDEAVRSSSGRSSNFRLIRGDIRDMEACREACDGADFVLHQAALVSVPRSFEDPDLNNSCNVTGFLNMLIASRDAGVRSFIFASSAAVYGEQPQGAIREDSPLAPLSPYAVAKRTDELYSNVLSSGMKSVGLRYMNAYGPRQDPSSPYSGVISIWMDRFLKGDIPVIYGDGKTTRDFVFAGDIVQANILAALSDPGGSGRENIFNIGTGIPTTIESLLNFLKDIIGKHRSGSGEVRAKYMPERHGDIRHSQADISLARKILGYEPRYSLADGLDITVKSFLKGPNGD
ncbi:MAG: SDR family oxidoreductase [Thermovirgaceae bacterium]|nr:SDR family oxidoreductase [Thermovirgaceae bacterium]